MLFPMKSIGVQIREQPKFIPKLEKCDFCQKCNFVNFLFSSRKDLVNNKRYIYVKGLYSLYT